MRTTTRKTLNPCAARRRWPPYLAPTVSRSRHSETLSVCARPPEDDKLFRLMRPRQSLREGRLLMRLQPVKKIKYVPELKASVAYSGPLIRGKILFTKTA